MIEKVNPKHPDKIADRIAGALVDYAYKEDKSPKIAVEVLVGHGNCYIIAESSVHIPRKEVVKAVIRITEDPLINVVIAQKGQYERLAKNQEEKIRCGDNGIFKGVPLTDEQYRIGRIARDIYSDNPFDGKYVLDGERLIICQSNTSEQKIRDKYPNAEINPLGYWIGGLEVDAGATNRKLGSDMADSITGGGLHGKDLSKADVSVNIYAFRKAQRLGVPVCLSCAIGDEFVDGLQYSEIVDQAKEYIDSLGGFEKFAEWGLW